MTIDTNQSVLDYINSVNETFVDTIDNESYPFTKIFEEHNFIPEIYYAYQVGLFDEKILKNGMHSRLPISIKSAMKVNNRK